MRHLLVLGGLCVIALWPIMTQPVGLSGAGGGSGYHTFTVGTDDTINSDEAGGNCAVVEKGSVTASCTGANSHKTVAAMFFQEATVRYCNIHFVNDGEFDDDNLGADPFEADYLEDEEFPELASARQVYRRELARPKRA